MRASTARWRAARRHRRADRGIARWAPVRRPARSSRTEILVRRGDAVSAPENPPEKRNRHAWRPSADPTRRVGTYVEPADWNTLISAPRSGHRHPQPFEVAMGSSRRGRSRHQKLRAIQGFRRRKLDPAKHSRSRCSAPAASVAKRPALCCCARFYGGLSPQGRHPEISGRRAGNREPLARRMLRLRRPRRARARLVAGTPNGAIAQ